MEAYEAFAQVYDLFMDDVPYDLWCEQICTILAEYGIRGGLAAELGCGTGQMTRRLARKGFDMIGIDSSAEMLQAAVKEQPAAAEDAEPGILYLQQDMREFELYGTVRAIISVCDSMNYILEEDALFRVFTLVNNYLDPGGIFVFDLNTPYKYREVIGERTIAETREEAAFIWENYFDEESGINEYDMTFFLREENGLFSRMTETHVQRAYEIRTVERLLAQSGLRLLRVYGEDACSPPDERSERVYFVARESGK